MSLKVLTPWRRAGYLYSPRRVYRDPIVLVGRPAWYLAICDLKRPARGSVHWGIYDHHWNSPKAFEILEQEGNTPLQARLRIDEYLREFGYYLL